jgi:hypothetical protein
MARPVFTLRVRAEPGVDVIRSLRGWLKQGLREFSLRCLDIHQETSTRETPMPNLNNIPRDDQSLAPPGVYQLEINVVRGDAGEDGTLTLAKNGRGLMLRALYTVIGGNHAGHKIWDYITVEFNESNDPNLPPIEASKLNNYRASVRMGLLKLRAIVDSAHGLLPDDASDAARAKRNLNSYDDIDGLKFWARVDERAGRGGYGPSNVIDYVITPDLPEYPQQAAQAVVAPPKRSLKDDFADEIPF